MNLKIKVLFIIFSLLFTTSSFSQTLKYAGTLPIKHHLTESQKLFADKVNEKTNGKLKIEIFPSGQLYKAHEIPSAVATGSVDIGFNLTTVWTKDLISEINDVPFLMVNANQVARAWDRNEKLFKYYSKIMENRQMKTLGVILFGSFFDISSNKKIVNPEDFNGKKIRTASAISSETIRALGGSPVTMDPAEMYLGLQSGTIDAAITGITSIDQRKLWENSKHVTVAGSAFGVFAVNMNLQTFNKLSKDNQNALMEAAAEVQQWSIERSIKEDSQSEDFLKTKVELIKLNTDQKQRWINKLEPVKNNWISKANAEEKNIINWVQTLK
jgi:TRAP-type C4-dicarboxylate transport system substrate-binding protein